MPDFHTILQTTGAGLVLIGAVLSVIGSLGVLRFPDVYTRIHAASITDTGGATVLILGMILLAGASHESLKLLIAWAFIMLTSPTASHALANAAFSAGHKPRFGQFNPLKGDNDTKDGGA